MVNTDSAVSLTVPADPRAALGPSGVGKSFVLLWHRWRAAMVTRHFTLAQKRYSEISQMARAEWQFAQFAGPM